MPTLNGPLQLSGVSKPKIWGRRDLAPFFAMPPSKGCGNGSPTDPIGEVWITDDLARFLNGPVAGMTLAEASAKYGPELHGKSWKGSRFPILAKYIFTSDWLSVQVHPDDAYAARRDQGTLGKYEMWYFLLTDPDASILLGLKPEVKAQQLRQAFANGTSRDLLQSFRPQSSEAVFLPAGMVHALGPGLVLFEIEENSDVTYRLDDFGRVGLNGRPRPLHIDQGMEVLRPSLPPLRDLPRLECKEAYGVRRFVLGSRFFALEELVILSSATFRGSSERVEGLSILEGEGRMENEEGWLAYRTGETWLIPPATDFYRLVPRKDTRFLKFYVPDLDKDFREPLKRGKYPIEKIQQIVFD